MITVFSRPLSGEKEYVQDKMRQRAAEIDTLLQQGALFYVCGDSKMAKDVSAVLENMIAVQRGLSGVEASNVLKTMRSENKYQEDAWS